MIGKINWTPSKRDMRWFGVIFLAGFVALSFLLRWKGRTPVADMLLIIGLSVSAFSLLFPRWALPFYWIWMGLGFVMGSVVSRLVLVLIFTLVLTPVGFVFRMIGRNALRINPKDKNNATHWSELNEIQEKSSYEHLF